ncbi:MAG TPA: transposase [Candidatus Paceibacterota bacterium]
MIRKTQFAPGEFYHVYNRGVDRRVLFTSEADYNRFLQLLYLANSDRAIVFEDIELRGIYKLQRVEKYVDIGGYCLMSNHFHILLRELTEGGTTRFMHKLSTAYTMYFNKKYERTGVLLQGPFKAKHANQDEYLKHLLTYIHMNPLDIIHPGWKHNGVKNTKSASKFLKEYRYSSLADYVEPKSRPQHAILSTAKFPEYYDSSEDMIRDIDEWQDVSPLFEHDNNGKAKPCHRSDVV